MRNLFVLLVTIIIASCNTNTMAPAKTNTVDTLVKVAVKAVDSQYFHHFNDILLEDRITDTLLKLSFIKRSNQYIDSFSNHQHGIAFLMDSLKKNDEGICVEAGYNGEQRFEPYYWFFVNPVTMDIRVYDLDHDKKIPLKEYLKKNH